MILGITAPLKEKFVYKVPNQGEDWGDLFHLFGVIILPNYPQESSWRIFSQEEKGELIHTQYTS